MTRVKVNVSGTCFEFDRNILNHKPYNTLTRLCSENDTGDKQMIQFAVDRPSECFGAILTYYQTDELHIPLGICPGIFYKELEFWEVSQEELAECCKYRYYTFFDELETRQKFQKDALGSATLLAPIAAFTSVKSFRTRVWNVIDNNEVSCLSKLYFGLVIGMVLLSIITLAYSTEPYLQRPVTRCELLEYMEHTNDDKGTTFLREKLKDVDCSNPAKGSLVTEFDTSDWYIWYEGWEDDDDSGETSSTATDSATTATGTPADYTGYSDLITNFGNDPSSTATQTTGNTIKMDGSTTPTNADGDSSENDQGHTTTNSVIRKKSSKQFTLPNISIPVIEIQILEKVALAFFTMDLFLRLFSCPSHWRYFTSVLNIIDILALVGSYCHLFVLFAEKEYRYMTDGWVHFLNYLQILRALRLFRVVKNVRASKVLAYSIKSNLRDATLLAMLLFAGISTFSCIIYFCEDRETIPSIPQAWYWAVVTMTTVGYGDISPKTGFGRLIASICAVSGVILLAVTLPIFVNNFLLLYQFSCYDEIVENKKTARQKLKGTIHAVAVVNTVSDKAKHSDMMTETLKKKLYAPPPSPPFSHTPLPHQVAPRPPTPIVVKEAYDVNAKDTMA